MILFLEREPRGEFFRRVVDAAESTQAKAEILAALASAEKPSP